MSSRYFSTEPSVCSTTSASISSRPSAASACAQSIVSATPGGFARSSPRRPRTNAAASVASRSGIPGHAQPDDLDLALDRRVPDPVEERAPLERVVQLARAVRGEDDRRLAPRADRPELGDRDLEVREHLEQERLELLVGAVDLVDQQDDRLVGVDRLEQRPPDQELRPEELLLGDRALLRGADVEQLARVVPLVDGVRDVEPLVALEPDQPRVERRRERLRRLRLADAGLALEQHRLLEREREEERRREPAVREVVGLAKRRLELVDRAEAHRSQRRRAPSPSVSSGVRRRSVAAPSTSASTIAPDDDEDVERRVARRDRPPSRERARRTRRSSGGRTRSSTGASPSGPSGTSRPQRRSCGSTKAGMNCTAWNSVCAKALRTQAERHPEHGVRDGEQRR